MSVGTVLLLCMSFSVFAEKPRFWNTGTVLGMGSFGTVYLGVDTIRGTEIAIKYPREHGSSEDMLLHEAKLLNGPFKTVDGVVKIKKLVNRKGTPALVLESLGQTVDDLIDSKKLSRKHTCMVFGMMQNAVKSVHSLGYCHRYTYLL